MMKKIKSLVTVIAVAAAMILPAGMCTLRASAAEPATFHIMYDQEQGGWYVAEWKDSPDAETDVSPKVLQFFYNVVKDGDYVVVTNDEDGTPQLDLGSARIGNLTLMMNSTFTMVRADYIEDFYALTGASCSITAPVTNAYVYDRNLVQLNDDVKNLIVMSYEDDLLSTIACTGTVDRLDVSYSYTHLYTLYHFQRGSLNIQSGALITPDTEYSTSSSTAPSGNSPVRTSNAEPATFYIMYDQEHGGWYVAEWKDSPDAETDASPKVLQFFYNVARDGDYVVVTNNEEGSPLLDLGSAKIGNLTLMMNSAFTMVKASYIEDFYVLTGTSCSITAPIANAYVYDRNLVQLNDNVGNLIVTSNDDNLLSIIACTGTVGRLDVNYSDTHLYTLYDFQPGSLNMQYGMLMTPDTEYSREPSPSTPAAPSQTPSQAPSGNSSDEYDKVPKTGDANMAAWLLCAGMLCMAFSRGLRKTSR